MEPVTGKDGLQVVDVLLLRREQLFQDLFPSAKISSTLNFDQQFLTAFHIQKFAIGPCDFYNTLVSSRPLGQLHYFCLENSVSRKWEPGQAQMLWQKICNGITHEIRVTSGPFDF